MGIQENLFRFRQFARVYKTLRREDVRKKNANILMNVLNQIDELKALFIEKAKDNNNPIGIGISPRKAAELNYDSEYNHSDIADEDVIEQ
jgi:hypothetical protein